MMRRPPSRSARSSEFDEAQTKGISGEAEGWSRRTIAQSVVPGAPLQQTRFCDKARRLGIGSEARGGGRKGSAASGAWDRVWEGWGRCCVGARCTITRMAGVCIVCGVYRTRLPLCIHSRARVWARYYLSG